MESRVLFVAAVVYVSRDCCCRCGYRRRRRLQQTSPLVKRRSSPVSVQLPQRTTHTQAGREQNPFSSSFSSFTRKIQNGESANCDVIADSTVIGMWNVECGIRSIDACKHSQITKSTHQSTTVCESLAPRGVEFSIRVSVIITRAKIDEILMQSNPDILNFAIQTFTIQYDTRKLEKRATNAFFVF